MTPAMCRTKHNPPHSYGDCLRACIATILDLDTDFVPHFADKGVDATETLVHVRRWLGQRGLTVATLAMPGKPGPKEKCPSCSTVFRSEGYDVHEVLEWMGQMNPGVTWLLFGDTGTTGDGLHVNVCQGGSVVHDPAWIPSSIKHPFVQDGEAVWQIWLVVRV